MGDIDIQSPPYPTVTDGMGCAWGVSSLPDDTKVEFNNFMNQRQMPWNWQINLLMPFYSKIQCVCIDHEVGSTVFVRYIIVMQCF